MKRLIACCTAAVLCTAFLCMSTGSAKETGWQVTPAEAGALVNENYYAHINFERFCQDSIPYDKTFVQAEEDWTTDALRELLHPILDDPDSLPEDAQERRMAVFYAQFLDEAAREADGLSAFDEIFSRIREAQDPDALAAAAAALQWEYGVSTLLPVNVNVGLFDSSRYAAAFGQMEMPVTAKELRENCNAAEALQRSFLRMLRMQGCEEDAAGRARAATDLLLTIAEATEDPEAVAVCTTLSELPTAELEALFSADISGFTGRLEGCTSVTVWDTPQLETIAALFDAEHLQAWKDYLMLQALYSYAQLLPPSASDIFASLDERPLPIRASMAEDAVIALFDKELSWMFAQRYADAERIEAVEDFARALLGAYADLIQSSTEADEPTKERFLEKLDRMQICIVSPAEPWPGEDSWLTTEEGGSLLRNMIGRRSAEMTCSLGLLGQETDIAAVCQWKAMPSYTFRNAAYYPANYVAIPYASIMDPFFAPDGDPAVNMAQLGFLLAHEISHAFDTRGLLFDADGCYAPNWIGGQYSGVLAQKKADITALYEGCRLFGIYPLDGEKTLGENMADLAAMQCLLTMAGETEAQQALMEEFARSWYVLLTDTMAYEMLLTDSHAPNEFRVNVILSQMDAFYTVYGIRDGAMYTAPADRRRIW